MLHRLLLLTLLAFFSACAWAQSQPPPAKNPPPPRSDRQKNPNESSSKDRQGDLSPPPEDVREHPDNYEVMEMHPYDPHRAEKDVEVGDFYFKRQNYKAAISRYCEALLFKSNDAIAIFRLAQALDRAGDLAGARGNYEGYLKLLPEGPFAAEAKKALQRITALPEQPSKGLAEQLGCATRPMKAGEADDLDRPTLRSKPTSPPAESPR